jgi:Holliday junction resolvase-like predicted endonuclease
VIRLLLKKNFKFLFQRARTQVCECDLIFEKDDQILLIEVKTIASAYNAFDRVGEKQLQKIRMNRHYLARCWPQKNFRAYIAFVQRDHTISFAAID